MCSQLFCGSRHCSQGLGSPSHRLRPRCQGHGQDSGRTPTLGAPETLREVTTLKSRSQTQQALRRKPPSSGSSPECGLRSIPPDRARPWRPSGQGLPIPPLCPGQRLQQTLVPRRGDEGSHAGGSLNRAPGLPEVGIGPAESKDRVLLWRGSEVHEPLAHGRKRRGAGVGAKMGDSPLAPMRVQELWDLPHRRCGLRSRDVQPAMSIPAGLVPCSERRRLREKRKRIPCRRTRS